MFRTGTDALFATISLLETDLPREYTIALKPIKRPTKWSFSRFREIPLSDFAQDMPLAPRPPGNQSSGSPQRVPPPRTGIFEAISFTASRWIPGNGRLSKKIG
jgi:hypothetical protein